MSAFFCGICLAFLITYLAERKYGWAAFALLGVAFNGIAWLGVA